MSELIEATVQWLRLSRRV